ncbi:MAG: hypothetical protein JHC84_20765 [Solirubrobacteraceae bacterium]|nr:hypothetical protein [Solirubrobacteraceae bacterium]
MWRRGPGVLVAVLLSLAVCAPGAGNAQDDGTKRRDVDLVLRVTGMDTKGSAKHQFDEFRASGSPFGASTVTTWTKRSERDADTKHPRFDLENDEGWIKGSMTVKRRYIKTTRTSQKVEYDGEGAIEDGGPARGKYRGAKGVIESFEGVITCRTSGRCSGTLRMRGWVRY